jgi:single-strand DNA-binding protein
LARLITLEGTLRYREVEDEVKGTTFKHRIAEIHATSMKRLSKVEATDDPSDGDDWSLLRTFAQGNRY